MTNRYRFFIVHADSSDHYCDDGDHRESKHQFLRDSVSDWMEIPDNEFTAVFQKIAELLKCEYGTRRLIAVEELPLTGGEIKVTLDLVREKIKLDEQKKREAKARRDLSAKKKAELAGKLALKKKKALYDQLKKELEV